MLRTLVRQLQVSNLDKLPLYLDTKQRWEHAAEIRSLYGFRDWTESIVGFRLSRWLYTLCWTGTTQPITLFDRATTWLLANKVILPGCTTLERFVAQLRSRVEAQLWKRLCWGVTEEQRTRLENLLTIPPEGRSSWLDKLRSGPVRVQSIWKSGCGWV